MVLLKVIKGLNNHLPQTNHWLALAASIPVGLSTGTIFVFAVYSTQLADKCELNSSQIANLNILCTLGSSIGAIIGGLITDYYGTQIPMLISSITLFWGYHWLYLLYSAGPSASYTLFWIAMFLIGVGSVAGYFSAIKAVTLHFPNFKGSAQSVTIASFAISALLFSYISNVVNDTQFFLKLLSIVCGLSVFIGFIFIRIDGSADEPIELVDTSEDTEIDTKSLKNLNIKDSLLNSVFVYHYIIFALIQGLGQMYIFSIGYILKAIHFKYASTSTVSLKSLQAFHVSIISVASFLGRLASGPKSDLLVQRFKLERHWVLIFGLVLMFTGHTLSSVNLDGWSFSQVQTILVFISVFIGYAYGFNFASYPAIISDIFNMKYYSLIWGTMYTATTFGLTVMSKLFGRNYDSHTTWDEVTKEYICKIGSNCYRQTFSLTSGLCVLSAALVFGYIYYSRKR